MKISTFITRVNYSLNIFMVKKRKMRKSVANVNGINIEKNPAKFFLNLEKL